MTTSTATFKIQWSNGRSETSESYDAAIAVIRADYPSAKIGHDGDLRGGGDHTLCWADEASSIDDDGARAVASIWRGQES